MSDADRSRGGRVRVFASTAPSQVTLFEDRAEVTRRARAGLPAGPSTLVLSGASGLLHDDSLQPRLIAGTALLASARVQRRIERPEADPATVAAAESDLRAASDRRVAADAAAERAGAAEERAAAVADAWCDALGRAPAGLQGAPEAFAAADAALAAALDQGAAARAAQAKAALDEQRARLRLEQARALHPRQVTEVELQLDAPAAGEVELELRYQVPCALWRPEHAARLVDREGGVRLQLRSFATCWQRTGEEWTALPLRFSTARPARQGAAPLLADDLLTSRHKTAEERDTVVVEAREQAIQLAGAATGAREVEEMPGVDDGGAPLLLEAARPATLPSDGAPVRVELQTLELPCELARVAFPELGPGVHLRATATWTGRTPLLAGPAQVGQRATFTGRGRLAFCAAGEPFEIGLGLDDGVRVRRSASDQHETAPITGTQRITRTVRVHLSNLSGEARAVTVIERVPVSELKQLQISVVESGGAQLDRDGFARIAVALGARESREVKLVWRVEAKAGVQLPGF